MIENKKTLEVQLVAGILCNRSMKPLRSLQQDGIASLRCCGTEGRDGVCIQAEQKGPQSTGAQREAPLIFNWWKDARS